MLCDAEEGDEVEDLNSKARAVKAGPSNEAVGVLWEVVRAEGRWQEHA